MNNVTLASTEDDAVAAAAVEQHHAEMAGALTVRVEALVAAASRHDVEAARLAKDDLVRWCRSDLLQHAVAEEKTIYPAARDQAAARLLVDAMVVEHGVITDLVDEVAAGKDPVRAAAAARALLSVFSNHLAKENDFLLPSLVASADVSVAELLDGVRELVGHRKAGHGGDSCGCGEVDGPGYPELDARSVPHAIRHATIFGALDAVRPGGGLLLVAPHDPIPLLGQIGRRWPEVFDVGYVERGPEAWRLTFVRRDVA